MIELAMISTPEVCTNNSLMKPNPYVSTKNPSARKSLRQFTETLDVKHNNAYRRLGAYSSKRKAMKEVKYCG